MWIYLAHWVDEPSHGPKDEEIPQDNGLHSRALHFDGHLLACVPQYCLIHLWNNANAASVRLFR